MLREMATATLNTSNSLVTQETVHCFVCDVSVCGRYFTLATCRTTSSKIRVIEKLGQLVGERYMVVISEDDIICRSCVNLINTLDRLETEMGSVRNVVLRFLEKKYSLEEGELVNDKSSGPGIPPQITSSASNVKESAGEINSMNRKRNADLSKHQNQQQKSSPVNGKSKKENGKSKVWMQCDKCKYTTNYSAFMMHHHIRQHMKNKPPVCDYCGGPVKGGNCIQKCSDTNFDTSSTDIVNPEMHLPVTSSGNINSVQLQPSSVTLLKQPASQQQCKMQLDTEAETVEMIAAEINSLSNITSNEVHAMVPTSSDMASKIESQGSQSTIQQHDIHSEIKYGQDIMVSNNQFQNSVNPVNVSPNEVTIQMPRMTQDSLHSNTKSESSGHTAICVMDMSEENSTEEPRLLVQKMDEGDDSNAVYVQVVEVGKTDDHRYQVVDMGKSEDQRNVPKQVLTVADDGTVEMVEVMWDEMVTTDGAGGQIIQF